MIIELILIFAIGFLVGKFYPKIIGIFSGNKKLTKLNKNIKNDYNFSIYDDLKMVFCVRQDLKMGTGKIAAQVGHAAISLFEEITSSNNLYNLQALNFWYNNCQKKIVLKVPSENVMLSIRDKLKQNNIKFTMIHDAGHTQIPAGSLTVIGIGPDKSEKIDKVTGALKLYS